MAYGVKRFYGSEIITIDERVYNKITAIDQKHEKAVDIEETFDVVLESYVELEITAQSEAIRSMVFNETFQTDRRVGLLLSQRLMSFLTACRLLREKFTFTDWFKFKPGQDGDDLLAMEGIRDWAQHHSFPVDGIFLTMNRPEPKDDNGYLDHSIELILNTKPFLIKMQQRKGSEDYCCAIRAMGDQINMLHATRRYIDIIAGKVEDFRTLTNYQQLENDICKIIDQYNNELKPTTSQNSTICVGELFNDHLSCNDSTIFSSTMMDYVHKLRKKNGNIRGLPHRRVVWV